MSGPVHNAEEGRHRRLAYGRRDANESTRVDVVASVVEAVRVVLASRVNAAKRLAVAYSGGRDSTVLLDAACRISRAASLEVAALHVHHGLSPEADRWIEHCTRECGHAGVPLYVERVSVTRASRTSLEDQARSARYDALVALARRARTQVVLLAHHQDDQAETLLLQLLRGSGPRGLAAMPVSRISSGVTWLRPLLDVPRAAIDAYAAQCRLQYVDDESNASDAHRRNMLRNTVIPALREIRSGYPATLARAAGLQAQAAELIDALAEIDAREHFDGASLACVALASVSTARACNVLRWFLRSRGLPAPSSARLHAMLAQFRDPRDDSQATVRHAGREVSLFRGRIHAHASALQPFSVSWAGGDRLALPHGELRVVRSSGGRIDPQRLFATALHVRSRLGGERMALPASAGHRSLKDMLREAGLPPWQRRALPLVFAGERLAVVPGIAVDPAFLAPAGTDGVDLVWTPDVAACTRSVSSA